VGAELGGAGGAVAGFGVFEFVLGAAHTLADKLFDHSDENALERLRREADLPA
jgi:hypothetical protein